MLSVFITPWMKPTFIQRAIERRLRVEHRLEEREVRVRLVAATSGWWRAMA